MGLKKIKESAPTKSSLRSGILDIVLLYSVNEKNSFFPVVSLKIAQKAEKKCFELFQKHKKELPELPSKELRELMSKLSLNCQSNIFHIINCFADEQIKELFNTPDNMPNAQGNYVVNRSKPYAYTGLIGEKVYGGRLDYIKVFEGYALLRENHSPETASLVMSVSCLANGIENSLFNASGVDAGEQNIYAVRLKKITEFFEANKEHLQRSYGSKVDTPLKWMAAFLENRYDPSPESYALRAGIKSYAEQLRLEGAVPMANNKKSVMKI